MPNRKVNGCINYIRMLRKNESWIVSQELTCENTVYELAQNKQKIAKTKG